MKVLITHSYFLRFDPKQWKLGQPYPPLAPLFAASLLRSKGFDPAFFDTMFCRGPAEIGPVLKKERPDLLVIYDDGFNYLTKMCLTNMREAAFSMAGLAKQAGIRVAVSSSDATDHTEKYLDKQADFIIRGEAEHTLAELACELRSGGSSFDKIDGLAYRKNGITVKTAPREIMRELDELPLPAWDLIDIEPYRKTWQRHNGYFSLNFVTTRGCPFKCNWCAKPIYGNRYNSHSPAYVVRALKQLVDKYRPDHFWFSDDIFGLKPKWIGEFASLVRQEKLGIRFKIQSRVDLLLEDDNIAALARAGCETVWVGAESGSQKILDAMEKGTKTEQIYRATALLKKHGIRPAFFIQFGYPGETLEDIDQTMRMLKELLPDDIGISVSYPLPGTGFYERVRNELKEKANWTDSDDLALMFRSTYSPRFYKQLHRYVHKNYRKYQGIDNLRKLVKMKIGPGRGNLRRALASFYFIPASYIEKQKLEAYRHDQAG
ncbi:MAG: radical SAM protein [Bacteroidota bacterium]